MKNEFAPYEPSLALKELGFNEPCLAKYSIDIVGETIPHFRYNNRISQAESIDERVWFNHNLDKEYIWSAPLYQQAFRWFREKYQIDSWIYPNLNGLYSVSNIRRGVGLGKVSEYQTYEEAELACLIKLIEIVKNK